jgi:hypothetical protein
MDPIRYKFEMSILIGLALPEFVKIEEPSTSQNGNRYLNDCRFT